MQNAQINFSKFTLGVLVSLRLWTVNLFCPCVSAAEDFSDPEDVLPKEISKWNSNDLMDKIEAADPEEAAGTIKTHSFITITISMLYSSIEENAFY